MKKTFMTAAIMLLAASVTVSAKKKEEVEILFGVKSGVVTISQDMGEMPDFGNFGGGAGFGGGRGGDRPAFNMSDMSEKIYFDDYGRKTARVTSYGDRITRTITIADSTYTINDTENTATVNPVFGSRRGGRGGMGGFGGFGMMGGVSVGTIGTIDWLNLDKKVIKKNKIKELGEETVAGVSCKKYSMRQTNAQMGTTTDITLWVYNGVVLKTETLNDWSTTPMTTTAVAFEQVAVPASTFELPEGCVVSQPQMRDFGGFGGGDFGGFGGGDFGGFGGGMGGMGGFGGGMGGFGGGF